MTIQMPNTTEPVDFYDWEPKTLNICQNYIGVTDEGKLSGQESYFIELTGEKISCKNCRKTKPIKIKSIEELIKEIESTELKYVTFTGCEPSIHDLREINNILRKKRIQTIIESKGWETHEDYDLMNITLTDDLELTKERFDILTRNCGDYQIKIYGEDDLITLKAIQARQRLNADPQKIWMIPTKKEYEEDIIQSCHVYGFKHCRPGKHNCYPTWK